MEAEAAGTGQPKVLICKESKLSLPRVSKEFTEAT
jgi:hypothetical protein